MYRSEIKTSQTRQNIKQFLPASQPYKWCLGRYFTKIWNIASIMNECKGRELPGKRIKETENEQQDHACKKSQPSY